MRKTNALLSYLALLLLGSQAVAYADPQLPTASPPPGADLPLVSVPNSHVQTFKSAINGNEYELFVFLPEDYERSNKRYPVLYLLDGNAWQAAYAAIQRLTLGGEMPHIILVGVGYAGTTMRSTDYPTVANSYWQVPEGRGAPVFMRVLKEEVLPRIEQSYRIDPTNRALGGHSMGGYFTLYTLFNSPETFQRYWISSPSLPWDHYVILQHEAAYAKTHKNLTARVFADMGELESEDVNDNMVQLESTLKSRGYPDLHWSSQTEPDLPHISVPNVAIVYALYYLYGREVEQVPAARLKSLVGTYKLSDGTTFRLATDGKSLFLDDFHSTAMDIEPALKRLKLLAHNPNSFFARYIGLNFEVAATQGAKPARLIVSHQLAEDQDPARASPPLTAERVAK